MVGGERGRRKDWVEGRGDLEGMGVGEGVEAMWCRA